MRIRCSVIVVGFFLVGGVASAATVSGERRVWHRIGLTVEGPSAAEEGEPNPFTDYRLTVVFAHEEVRYVVPGFYAADGSAGETGASRGAKWRAYFVPDRPGEWTYRATLRKGEDVAISETRDAGRRVRSPWRGRVEVAPAEPSAPGFRGPGMLRPAEGRYLRFAGTGEAFLKAGAGSPENFLAYAGFDNTRRAEALDERKGESFTGTLHRYAPHVSDWREGDPTWGKGRGKGIVGAVNYLASEEVNSIYMLTMNVGGDGKDVWPWREPTGYERFDCSKLAQWEIVFSHMDRRGLQLHLVTQETENDQLLDGGDLGRHRKLYYREMVARFAHHLGVTWNLGEENTNTPAQRKAFAREIRALDPYDHPIVCHTYPDQHEKVYEPLLGFTAFDGPSLQLDSMGGAYAITRRWLDRSAAAGRPWFVCIDEPGTAKTGAKPDTVAPAHAAARRRVLWPHLMAGGSGVAWYFGYDHPHDDLSCEDWRSRDALWDQTRHAVRFFREHLSFTEMVPRDAPLRGGRGHCLAKRGEVYALYLPVAKGARVELPKGEYRLRWYDPRRGGELVEGSVSTVEGGAVRPLGVPPERPTRDWAAVLTREGSSPRR